MSVSIKSKLQLLNANQKPSIHNILRYYLVKLDIFLRLPALLLCVSIIIIQFLFTVNPAFSETSIKSTSSILKNSSSEKMQLKADQLIYDNDQGSISAIGNVQINYDGNNLTADEVTYYHQSARLVANGKVKILEKNGNRIIAEKIDITSNFQKGFVNALTVKTANNMIFSAKNAKRYDNKTTQFENAMYTACKLCLKNPTKPPFWQIKASKIIVDGKINQIFYEKASFRLLGVPIAYIQKFSYPDPRVKRKTGILIPEFMYKSDLGFGVKNTYFLNLASNFDLTVAGTYYSKQGFLGQAEWRHLLKNGSYNLRFAGISQRKKAVFLPESPIDAMNSRRFMIASKGKFDINHRWKFGWNWLYQSDRTFSRTYDMVGYDKRDIINQAYLTGLNGKNYFDLRGYKFLVQDQTKPELKQAKVLPVIDYNYIFDSPVAGGQLAFDFNFTGIRRSKPDNAMMYHINKPIIRNYGVSGTYHRISFNLDWKRPFITNQGFMITPSISLRSNTIWQKNKNLFGSKKNIYQIMPTAGLEIRYPLVARTKKTSHVFEPIVQVFIRPNERYTGQFPNEDAQSLVFNTTNLFSDNKFSGFDRMEGGTRANLGFRYLASFPNGTSFDLTAGQSYQLAGLNSYKLTDTVNSGLGNGLEDFKSDYVAGIGYNMSDYLRVMAQGRFDRNSFNLNRADLTLSNFGKKYQASLNYTFIRKQPNYGIISNRNQIVLNGSLKFNDNWKLLGSNTFDIERSKSISKSIGIAYDNECFSMSIKYNIFDKDYTSDKNTKNLKFAIGLRTFGNYKYSHGTNDNN